MTTSAQGAINELVQLERRLLDARQALTWLAERGAVTRADYDTFNAIAGQVLSFENAIYAELTTKLRVLGVPDALIEQVPAPVPLGISPPDNLGGPAERGVGGATSNADSLRVKPLGALPVIGWAAVIVGLVVFGVVVWKVLDTISISTSSAQALVSTAVQALAFMRMLSARVELFASCIRSGRSPEECARVAMQLAPTPPRPVAPPAPGGIPQWVIALAVVGGVALVGTGAYGYVLYKRGSRRGSAPSGSGMMDRAIGNYALEVE